MKTARLTAATITDAQIRGLMDDAWRLHADACHALGFSPIDDRKYNHDEAREYRARCAEHLNENTERSRELTREACDLADEANGDPSSCSHNVPIGERIAEIRKEVTP